MFEWTSWLRKVNIQLQYYLKLNPYTLKRSDWARRYLELEWIRKEESQQWQVK